MNLLYVRSFPWAVDDRPIDRKIDIQDQKEPMVAERLRLEDQSGRQDLLSLNPGWERIGAISYLHPGFFFSSLLPIFFSFIFFFPFLRLLFETVSRTST